MPDALPHWHTAPAAPGRVFLRPPDGEVLALYGTAAGGAVTLAHDYPDLRVEAGWVVEGVGVVKAVAGRVLEVSP